MFVFTCDYFDVNVFPDFFDDGVSTYRVRVVIYNPLFLAYCVLSPFSFPTLLDWYFGICSSTSNVTKNKHILFGTKMIALLFVTLVFCDVLAKQVELLLSCAGLRRCPRRNSVLYVTAWNPTHSCMFQLMLNCMFFLPHKFSLFFEPGRYEQLELLM